MNAKGFLQDVVTHEMGHVLGFGTQWPERSLLSPSNCASMSPPFTATFLGANAKTALPLINYNGTSVRVEDTGGSGTQCGHWKESIFKTELMTGTISKPGNPLSKLTAYALRDMGYTINPNSAKIDAFNVATATGRLGGGEPLQLTGCLDGKFHEGTQGLRRKGSA